MTKWSICWHHCHLFRFESFTDLCFRACRHVQRRDRVTRVTVNGNCEAPHHKSTLGRLLSPLRVVDSGTLCRLKLNSFQTWKCLQQRLSKTKLSPPTLCLDGGSIDLWCVFCHVVCWSVNMLIPDWGQELCAAHHFQSLDWNYVNDLFCLVWYFLLSTFSLTADFNITTTSPWSLDPSCLRIHVWFLCFDPGEEALTCC